jgi:hypothetical protein
MLYQLSYTRVFFGGTIDDGPAVNSPTDSAPTAVPTFRRTATMVGVGFEPT